MAPLLKKDPERDPSLEKYPPLHHRAEAFDRCQQRRRSGRSKNLKPSMPLVRTDEGLGFAHRLQSSSFWGLPCGIPDINHKKELQCSLWVGLGFRVQGFLYGPDEGSRKLAFAVFREGRDVGHQLPSDLLRESILPGLH